MIDTEHFTPWLSLGGGALVGLAAAMLLLLDGHIAGVSGVLGGALQRPSAEGLWRYAFLLGLVVGGAALGWLAPAMVAPSPRSLVVVGAAGLLVGVGTQIGSGCTSGHGVCGLSRQSVRSLAATLTFMATGAITVFVARVFFAGSAP